MMAYEFKPDAINSIVPSPRYIDKALNHSLEDARDNKYNAERYRTSTLVKRQNETRYQRGRLYSHIKLQQIRQQVSEMRAS